MVKTPRFCCLAGFLLMVSLAAGVTFASPQPRGYLAVLGPGPLRFRPPRLAMSAVQLPPLLLSEVRKVDAASQSTNAPAMTDAPGTNAAPLTIAVAAAPTNVLSTAASTAVTTIDSPSSPDAAVIDPQSILGYLAPPAT